MCNYLMIADLLQGPPEEVYHPPGKNGNDLDDNLDDKEVSVSDNGDAEDKESKVDAKEGDEKKKEEVNRIVNSKIISASVGERKDGQTQKLSEPIYYTLEHKTVSHMLLIGMCMTF